MARLIFRDLTGFRELLIEASNGLAGFGEIQHWDKNSAILDEPILLEFAESFIKELSKKSYKCVILKNKGLSNKIDTYCAVVFAKAKNNLQEPLDYMLERGYEILKGA